MRPVKRGPKADYWKINDPLAPIWIHFDGWNAMGLSIVLVCDRCGNNYGPVFERQDAINLARAHAREQHPTDYAANFRGKS